MAHSTAVLIASATNPILLLLLLIAPFAGVRDERAWRFWLISAVAVAVAVALAEVGKQRTVWPGHPSFPSGHETFALAAATRLAQRSLRWLWIAAPLCALLAWALVAANFHEPRDAAGALLIGPPVALIAQAVLGTRTAKARSTPRG